MVFLYALIKYGKVDSSIYVHMYLFVICFYVKEITFSDLKHKLLIICQRKLQVPSLVDFDSWSPLISRLKKDRNLTASLFSHMAGKLMLTLEEKPLLLPTLVSI